MMRKKKLNSGKKNPKKLQIKRSQKKKVEILFLSNLHLNKIIQRGILFKPWIKSKVLINILLFLKTSEILGGKSDNNLAKKEESSKISF